MIVETHSHLRESHTSSMATFLSPDLKECQNFRRGLYRPHTGKATVTRTGTLPPTSCGKGPNAVGKSVMVLPGNPPRDAVRLTCKGRDLSGGGRAAVVVGGREGRPQGEERQARGLLAFQAWRNRHQPEEESDGKR